jgi:hypothetical protein
MADENSPGPGVDASGWPVRDPTETVIALQAAAVKRQDDLRALEGIHVREILSSQKEHFAEILALRERYEEKLANKESARIDAIRTVDVANVQRAAEVAAEAVQTLATQVPITAEAVRAAQAQALDPITKAIAELQRAQYELQGQKVGGVETKDSAAELAAALALAMNPVVQGLTAQGEAVAALVRDRNERTGASTATADTHTDTTRRQNFRFAIIGAGIAATGLFVSIGAVIIAVILASKP